MRRTGKILLSAAGMLCICLIIGTVQFLTWKRYEPPTTVGSCVKTEETNLISVTKQWYENYIDSLKGPGVPYDWRIHSARQIYIIPLEQPGYVELAYLIQPESRNLDVISNLGLAAVNGNYTAQMVLYWEQETDGWKLADTMTPAAYDLKFPSAEEQKEREIAENTHHYQMDDSSDQTYFVQNETLYVTYDGGNTSVEVPDGYELVCMGGNEIPDEYLERNSYVVSPEFTGFIGYKSGYAVLLYSEDQGESWNQSKIAPGYKARSFLSTTENGCYAAFAADRALGNDYYGAYYSADFKNWNTILLPEDFSGHLTGAYWEKDGTGYFADDMSGYVQDPSTGAFQTLSIQEPEDLTAQLGYNPFHEIQYFYEKDGGVYLVAGQGSDGDFTIDGQLVQGLYYSEDGVHFYFQETIADNPTEAG